VAVLLRSFCKRRDAFGDPLELLVSCIFNPHHHVVMPIMLGQNENIFKSVDFLFFLFNKVVSNGNSYDNTVIGMKANKNPI